MASGRGVDYKLIQTDPYSINTADKFTQAISKKTNGGSQTDYVETRVAGSTDSRTTRDGATDPMSNTKSSGSSTDRRATSDAGNDPMYNPAESSSQVAPISLNTAGDPAPMEQHEEQVVQKLEEAKSLNKKKQDKAAARVKNDLEKTKHTTGTIKQS